MLPTRATATAPVFPSIPVKGAAARAARPQLFEPAGAALLGAVAATGLAAQETLFVEGDEARFFYRIVDGCVCAYKLMIDGRRQITGFHGRGELVGIGVNGVHAYGVEAITPTRVQRYRHAETNAVAARQPQMARWLLDLAKDELRRAQDQLLLLGRKTAPERLASFLLRMARREGDDEAIDALVALPMSRTHIADYLGLTIETVSRTFTRLRSAGLIAFREQGFVELLDADILSELADGCASV